MELSEYLEKRRNMFARLKKDLELPIEELKKKIDSAPSIVPESFVRFWEDYQKQQERPTIFRIPSVGMLLAFESVLATIGIEPVIGKLDKTNNQAPYPHLKSNDSILIESYEDSYAPEYALS